MPPEGDPLPPRQSVLPQSVKLFAADGNRRSRLLQGSCK